MTLEDNKPAALAWTIPVLKAPSVTAPVPVVNEAAPVRVRLLLKVFAPPNVCAPVETNPTLVASAVCKKIALEAITAPLALLVWESIAPTEVTPLPAPSMLVGVQAAPFQIYCCELPAAISTPCIEKLAIPTLETKTIRPAVAAVGAGNVRVWPAVVWLMLNVVSTSTVVGAVPIDPPVAKLVIVAAVFKVEPLFVNWLPLTVKLPDNVVPPVTVKLPPKLVAPVPTLNGLLPVTLVVPFNETVPVPVLMVPAPV